MVRNRAMAGNIVLAAIILFVGSGCAGTRSSIDPSGNRKGTKLQVFPISQEDAEFVMFQAISVTAGANVSTLPSPRIGYSGTIEFLLDKHTFTVSAIPVGVTNSNGESLVAFAFEVAHSGTFGSGPARAKMLFDRTLLGAQNAGLPIELTAEQVFSGRRVYAKHEPRDVVGGGGLFGTGFFVTTNGYLLSNFHVVEGAQKVHVRYKSKEFEATIVRKDPANDLVLLKVEGSFPALDLAENRARMGDPVFTIGFPNPETQGMEPKFTDGRISALSGIEDSINCYQITVPVQPGNSGGPLIDMDGKVVGVIVSRLGDLFALKATGSLPQNVSYAIKSDYCRLTTEGIAESLPTLEGATRGTAGQAFSSVVEKVQQAVALVVAR